MSRRRSYTATCTRFEGWWAVRVEGVRGVHTQARRLDQVETNMREVLEDSFDVEVRPMLPEGAAAVLRRTEHQRQLAEESAVQAAPASREAVRVQTSDR